MPGRISLLSHQFYFQHKTSGIAIPPPDNWLTREKNDWLLVHCHDLPVLTMYSSDRLPLGWLLGYPILNNAIQKSDIYLDSIADKTDHTIINDFIYQLGGRWIAFFFEESLSRLYLDPSGSLSSLFSLEEPIICSTSSAIHKGPDDADWNKELMSQVTYLWYPCGITAHRSLQRILPNHYLDLKTWQQIRHWPEGPIEPIDQTEIASAIVTIADQISEILTATISEKAYITLTAGRDSRMLLACSKKLKNEAIYFTSKTNKLDIEIASRLAKEFQLSHIVVPEKIATSEQKSDRLYISGYSTEIGSMRYYGEHRAYLDENRLQIAGMGGEVGRAYWSKRLEANQTMTSELLIEIMGFPIVEQLIRAAEAWLQPLMEQYDASQILDLAFLEQRIGCCHAPNNYAYDALTLSPVYGFSHRRTYNVMWALPFAYRRSGNMAQDLCAHAWPETLRLPFNRYVGIKGQLHSLKSKVRHTGKRFV